MVSPTKGAYEDTLTDAIWAPGNPIKFINAALVWGEHQNTRTAVNASFYSNLL